MHQAPSWAFDTSVYRKATNAGIVLHYDSNSPASLKCSSVTSLFNRIKSHCSNANARNHDRNYLHQRSGNTAYPLNFIACALRHRNSQPPPTTNGETVLPTWPEFSYAKKLIARRFQPFNFAIPHKPIRLLRGRLVNVKDRLPTLNQRNAVYQIPFSYCPNANAGQTGRQLSASVKEHKGAARRQAELLYSPYIATHST